MEKNRRILTKTIIEYSLVSITGMLFILFASSWTSPLFWNAYGYDSAFFSMMGRAILAGKVPYRDYFDLKGPVFFFIEAFGQLLCRDRFGVVILQFIAISASAVAIYKTCLLYITKKQAWFILLFFYYFYITFLWGGNSVEELCLPFNMICIYMGMKYLKDQKWSRIDTPSFFFGLSFGIMVLSKVTVAAPMMAMTLTILIVLIYKKQAKYLPRCIILFLCGTLFIAIPTFVYYITRGALKDMLFCTFSIGFKRGTDFYEGFSLKWERNLLLCDIGLLYGIFMNRNERMKKLILVILSMVTYLLLHLGTPFPYYFITTLPVLVVMGIFFFYEINTIDSKKNIYRLLIIEFIFVAVVAEFSSETKGKLSENYDLCVHQSEAGFYFDCKEIYELIPESEREDVYCLESGMIFFEVNQMLPNNKYIVNCPYFIELNPPAEKEILDILNNHTPKWLISENVADFDNDKVKYAVYNNYEIIANNSAEHLYRRIDKKDDKQ